MDSTELYDEQDGERLVAEPPKRVEAPERTPYERDRARVVHAAASRRLAAKTQRLLTRLEAKTVTASGESAGLNLTRATLDACTKYPWSRTDADEPRGVQAEVSQTVRDWYLPEADDGVLDKTLAELRTVGSWPETAYDGSRHSLAALKNLTSDLIGRFCGAVQHATFGESDGPFVRYAADLVVPEETRLEIAVLKGIAAHYVMRADDRVALMERQRELLAELVTLLADRGPDAMERPFADDWAAAPDDAGRLRVVLDQAASLTDQSAVAWHAELRRT